LDEDAQFRGICDAIAAIAQLNFDTLAPVSGADSTLDGVAVGLNLLAEELQVRVRDRKRVDGVLNSIRDSVVVVSDRADIRYANEAAMSLLELDGESPWTGTLAERLRLPESAAEDDEPILPLDSCEPRVVRRHLRRKHGHAIPVLISIAPLTGRGASQENGHVCVLFGQRLAADQRRWLAGSTETRVPFSVATLVDEVVRFHQASAKALGLQLEADYSPSLPPWVLGARSPLQAVLHSLLEAAMQWSRTGTVHLKVTAVQAQATSRAVLRFRIDNHTGEIDESLRRRLFAPDIGPEDDMDMTAEGQGMSLQTAAIVAEGMGGSLGLHRGPDGEFAARLWIDLPTPST